MPDASVLIQDNASGCNSRDEVEYACLVGEYPEFVSDSKISIYPNPANNSFNFSSTNTFVLELNIYNLLGRKVLTEIYPENTINVSSINSGVYIVEFVSSHSSFNKKLIIN